MHKVGDIVVIKDHPEGRCDTTGYCSNYTSDMFRYIGKRGRITHLEGQSVRLDIDGNCYHWSDCMISPQIWINPPLNI